MVGKHKSGQMLLVGMEPSILIFFLNPSLCKIYKMKKIKNTNGFNFCYFQQRYYMNMLSQF